MDNENSVSSKLDYTLIFIIFLLACISIITLYFAPYPTNLSAKSMIMHQGMWFVIGGLVIAGIYIMDYDRFKFLSWIFYGIFMLLLFGLFAKQHGVPVPFAGDVVNGAVSWYNLPGIGSVQPSEFMKIVLILIISQIIVKHNESQAIRQIKDDFILLGKIVAVAFLPLIIVLLQPDLGTVTVYLAIIASLIIISGIRWRIIIGLFLIAVILITALVICYFYIDKNIVFLFIEQHQLDRFYGWLDPQNNQNQEGYQLLKSLMKIGSGELYGRGFAATNFSIPEGWTDFIFAVICGTFGFVGGSITIAIYFLLVYRLVNAALKTHDSYGTYICTGIIGMLTFTIFENIGMTIQLMPITGIPLPFISYGGSALLTNMIAIGLVLSIEARSRQYMFD
ncbi:cell division protein FtsW (lipid II flippase) [Pullulanibacillus pueri]|uniref:Cell division protein FtsW n=1 Tax=Pullulanibacillus pueri TaxID=1437324 RepID=A0A8J2ZX32_9BACL|nr:FtsW/RodA/SpoVE family cell cycle protein [Pullulanibacillus pueri]MBM7680604.1 cell division protein FtsW (lipid II flippase) [Pullulanibacillus pueri]GGH83962.1 cell division protein FtsW [Pullulanibacillus pueri]